MSRQAEFRMQQYEVALSKKIAVKLLHECESVLDKVI
jgi:hypothetical protein